MPICLNIKQNAIFVADAHFNIKRNELSVFLDLIEQKKINPPQLFLMGDMFDFLTQESFYFVKQNSTIIKRLNNLSKEIEIIYLEGNHDYNLEKLFPNIEVISREKQPLKAYLNKEEIALSHGDNFTPTSYNIYCKIIRNKPLLKFLNAIDFNHWLSCKIDKALTKKNICHEFKNFEELVERRLKNYKTNTVIEGHFHQGKEYTLDKKRYVNVPSLFCSKAYMVLEEGKFITQYLTQKKG
ncbi:MAG: UDP-2,3-diacylglucosamine diphosphatase [Arcobacteraceae bacterium]